MNSSTVERVRSRLRFLYADRAEECLAQIRALVEQYARRLPRASRSSLDEREVVLITYGDQVRRQGEAPLATLREFLVSHGLDRLIRTVHVLPFCPYSSDDGFSVIDYRTVDPMLGTWDDIRRLGQHFGLMFDLVLNHTSSRSLWFEDYRQGQKPYVDYFIEVDPAAEVSEVTRPRSLPLLTAVETSRGTRHVWTTFSPDQVDLNFANPDVLVEMLDVLLFYVQQGARILRLDAIAYLWKELGTPCIHLPQTHEVVKLMRDVIEDVAPHVLLLTETNVPHAENISYLGQGDEAHMVYQFSLPPLLLDAMVCRDARPLVKWLAELQPVSPGAAFLNFTASHDGIGVRPLEGLVSKDHLDRLIQAVEACGGLVSVRRQPDGLDAPYELNVSYLSALNDPAGTNPELHARRFLASQALMLSLQGVPAVYFHSLVGTPNDVNGVQESGQPRRINRRKFGWEELSALLEDTDSLSSRIFARYLHMLSVRVQQPAFHPDAPQRVWRTTQSWLVAFSRTSIGAGQEVLVLANVSDEAQTIASSAFNNARFGRDILTGRRPDSPTRLTLRPAEVVWMELEETPVSFSNPPTS